MWNFDYFCKGFGEKKCSIPLQQKEDHLHQLTLLILFYFYISVPTGYCHRYIHTMPKTNLGYIITFLSCALIHLIGDFCIKILIILTHCYPNNTGLSASLISDATYTCYLCTTANLCFYSYIFFIPVQK